MSAFAIVQALIIAAVVGFSAWQAFRKLAPQTAKRVQAHLSAALDRPTRSVGLRGLGRWLQPREAKSGGCGSSDGCSSCGGCAPKTVAPDAMPLNFRQRS